MMGKQRSPLFSDTDDLSDFAPTPRSAKPPLPPREEVEAVARSTGFTSREPRPAETIQGRAGRAITGRNAQINLKARQSTIDVLSAIADQHDWSKALTFERAVAALQRLLAQGVDPKTLDLPD